MTFNSTFVVRCSALLLTVCIILSISCKRDNVKPGSRPQDEDSTNNGNSSPFTGKILSKRPLLVEYWGGCCYSRTDVGPLDALPDSVDVVNIFTLGIGKTSTGDWEFEHRGVSGQNNWEDVLTIAHNLQKRGIRIVATSFAGGLVNLSGSAAAAMAQVVKDSLDKWQFDGVDLDLEYGNTRSANIDSGVIALGKYLGPASQTGRILSVVDYNNYNRAQIIRSKQYIDYVMTMSYWNTASAVRTWIQSYGNAIGDTKNVLIGVGAGCAINAGQATPKGEELKIADTLRAAFPGTGMMEFVFGCNYHSKDQNGNITKDISYTTNIIKRLKL
jgi:hypothetical protein